MDEKTINDYVWIITHNIICHDRFFGAKLNEWKFMLVSQPKIPFANDSKIPNIAFTYNLKNEATAKLILGKLSTMLLGNEYVFNNNDNGQYLICYYS